MERTLKKGMSGSEVLLLQETLIKHGYDIQKNGHFGIFTDRAVHNFQTRHGLVSDGIVGFRTRRAMGLDRLPVPQTGLLYHRRKGSNYPLGHRSNPSGPPEPSPLSGFFHNVSDVARRIGGDINDFIHSAFKASVATHKKPLVMKGGDNLQNVKGMHISEKGLKFIFKHEALKGVSNRLHWPRGSSGVTLGAGYDMMGRKPPEIEKDMMKIGLDSDTAKKVAKASGLGDDDARIFAKKNKDLVNLTADQETKLLIMKVPDYEYVVKHNIKVMLYQHQYDALVCYAYNAGGGHTRVYKLLNEGKVVEAMVAMHKPNTSGGKVSKNLQQRREDEIALFLYNDYGRIQG